MKPINAKRLDDIRVGFQNVYESAFNAAVVNWDKVAMHVPSSAKAEVYGWLGQLPRMREWLGDRVINGLKTHDFTIVNKDFELTVGVSRNDIEDDTLGVYKPMFEALGDAAKRHPDELVYALLAAGFDTLCYDGQYFFDTDHPVLDKNGVAQSQSNSGGGGGAAWFLLDTTKVVKPFIFQERKKPEFVSLDKSTDPNVFSKKEFLYGVDSRDNAGFGLWQLAYGSKQTLDATSYAAGRSNILGRKGDYEKPLGLKPNLLVVGPSNEKAALELVKAERNAAGATNIYQGTAEVFVSEYLT